GSLRCRVRCRELLLAARDRVARVDHAGVGVVTTVQVVVPGDAVPGLQEVVPGLALLGAVEALVAVRGDVVGVVAADVVVPLTAVELVVLAVAADLVVVGLPPDDVGAVVTGAEVVALAQLDDVV